MTRSFMLCIFIHILHFAKIHKNYLLDKSGLIKTKEVLGFQEKPNQKVGDGLLGGASSQGPRR